MNKKGFTLVEMMVVIGLMAFIMLIVVPNVTGMLKKIDNEKYQRFLSDVFLATEAYVQKNIEEYPNIKEVNEKIYIYYNDLISSNYLKSTTYDPKEKKQVKNEDYTVEVFLNDDNEYKYKVLEEHYIPCSIDIGEEYLFEYTGSEQDFTALCDGNYKLETWGASGYHGGAGGYSVGVKELNKDDNLYVYVGEAGKFQSKNSYNGGGVACGVRCGTTEQFGGGGGGTDIRLTKNNLYRDRIIVAGGGGAGPVYSSLLISGYAYGGGVTAGPGYANNGIATTYPASGAVGGQGSVTNCGCWSSNCACTNSVNYYSGYTGGGGGGYVGGYGVKSNATDPSPNWVAQSNGASQGGTGYVGGVESYGDITAQTIGGNQSIPTHDGTSTMTGNTGNGYAKITFLGN